MGRIREIAAGEDGSSTIEAVLWLPVFIGAFCLMADAAFIFNGQTIAMRTVQDANRNMSIGRLQTTSQVEQEVVSHLSALSPNVTAQSSIVAGSVVTRVTIPSSDLVATGWLNRLMDINLVIRSEHLIEH
ncbi:TadE family protein [Actibacterium sp. MT2.3-13A]|uniref:TadE/TadG family type IV pilus assembly protein n=1 Tax=Actibacterium sp. MT2.3-13A TaxID=2828332 RepID=UPI001BA4586A|nr:TadE family protein [Actibacterium sp. MT2.3-13A]